MPGFRYADSTHDHRIMRYMFIAYRVRMESDHRTFGDLFYACCQELDDIGFLEAFHRIMTLAVEQLRQMGTFCKKTAMAFFDTMVATALKLSICQKTE